MFVYFVMKIAPKYIILLAHVLNQDVQIGNPLFL